MSLPGLVPDPPWKRRSIRAIPIHARGNADCGTHSRNCHGVSLVSRSTSAAQARGLALPHPRASAIAHRAPFGRCIAFSQIRCTLINRVGTQPESRHPPSEFPRSFAIESLRIPVDRDRSYRVGPRILKGTRPRLQVEPRRDFCPTNVDGYLGCRSAASSHTAAMGQVAQLCVKPINGFVARARPAQSESPNAQMRRLSHLADDMHPF